MRRLALVLLTTLFAGPAAAQGSAASSGIRVSGCPATLAGEVEYFVSVELGALTQASVTGEVRVTCSGPDVLVVVTEDGRSKRRRLNLRDTEGSVQARVLALTVAELVSELRAPARAEPPKRRPAPPPPPPEREPEPEPEPPRAEPVVELEVFAQASRFTRSDDTLWGGGLRFVYVGFDPWRVSLDFGAGTYERDAPLGSVRLVAASLGMRLGYGIALGDSVIELGAGERVGVARVTGKASDFHSGNGGSVVGAWSAPFGFIAADTALGSGFRIGLDAEVGPVLLPVRGRIQDSEDVKVDGVWAALQLGLAVEL